MSAILGLLFGWGFFLTLLVTITPIPAILCFSAVWEKTAQPDESAFTRSRYAFPTTVAPLVLLYIHFGITNPVYRNAGDDYRDYLSIGDAVFVFGTVFALANLVVGRSIVWPLSQVFVLPTFLGLSACLLICLFFGLHQGIVRGNPFAVFPFSAGMGYVFGIYYLMKASNRVRMFWWSIPAVIGWLAASGLTVLVAISKTKTMVERLPAENPEQCFVVTAAARRGSQGQLYVFREFERWLVKNLPALHDDLRAKYNIVGPLIATRIRNCWLADVAYFGLKPLEWIVWTGLQGLKGTEAVTKDRISPPNESAL